MSSLSQKTKSTSLIKMLSKFFNYLWDKAYQGNNNNIINLLEHNPKAKFLDLGCSDGTWTTECAKKIGTKQVYT